MQFGSEIMLQQTAQGPLFSLFSCISHCFDLAEANEEEVLKLWQGLILLSCYFTKQLT
jgi:adenine-specific DNA glycosylase